MAELVDIHALAGAYALDAVDEIERKAFERHLRDCASCLIEVEELKETTSWLSYAVAAPPPPNLRDSVLAQVAQTPQTVGKMRPQRQQGPQRWRQWTAAAVAAVVVGAGVGTATWVVSNQQVKQERVAAQQVQAVLGAPDAKLVSSSVEGGAISLIVSPSHNAAVAVLNGLASPDDAHAYQLWMISGSGPTDVGLLNPGEGSGQVYIPDLFGASTFGLSREDKAGSPRPTDVVKLLDF
jgi:anti-sigma-K factor RskA